jgi:hypothetical protein
MARQLIIVSRQHPDLYVYLRDRFVAEREVAVILDRRLAERRRERVPAKIERRRLDRRLRLNIDVQLRQRSLVVMTTR